MEIGHMPGSKAVQIPLLVIVPLLVLYVLALEFSRETVDIIVEDKSIVTDNDPSAPSDKWLVYTPDEIFTVAGDWTHGELYAGKRFGDLKPGKAYRVQVAGWRIAPLDWYRKIVSIEQASP